MQINKDKINQVIIRYNELKGVNVHINDSDDKISKRQKDIMFGKLLGYEEILIQLGIFE